MFLWQFFFDFFKNLNSIESFFFLNCRLHNLLFLSVNEYQDVHKHKFTKK